MTLDEKTLFEIAEECERELNDRMTQMFANCESTNTELTELRKAARRLALVRRVYRLSKASTPHEEKP